MINCMADTQKRVYPKTLATSVSYTDNKTVKAMLDDGVYVGNDAVESDATGFNDAQTLNGHPASYFATASDVNTMNQKYNTFIDNVNKISTIETATNQNKKDIATINTNITKIGEVNDSQTEKITDLTTKVQNQETVSNEMSGTLSDIYAILLSSDLYLYRGKDITPYLTDGSLFTRVSSGKFNDIIPGDYFTMNIAVEGYSVTCNKFVVVGINNFYGKGDIPLTKNHIVVMPADNLFAEKMNQTKTNSTGYFGSYINQTVMPKIAAGLTTVLGEHLLTYRDNMSTNISATGTWTDVTVSLCASEEIFGVQTGYQSISALTGDKKLNIFRGDNTFKNINSKWWLSTIYTGCGCGMVYVDEKGALGPSHIDATGSYGIRPRFLIG